MLHSRAGGIFAHFFMRITLFSMANFISLALIGQSVSGSAQITSSVSATSWQAPKDDSALQIVNAAIAKMGGNAAVSAITDASGSGSCSYPASGGDGSAPSTEPFTWTISGTEFLYESGTGQGQTKLASGHGKPSRLDAGQTVSWSYSSAHAIRPYQIPALVLRTELNDVNFGLKNLGQQTFMGSQVNVVQIAMFNRERTLNDTLQLWYFSSATGLPVKVEFLQPSERAPEVFSKVSEIFSGFESQSGILIPMSIGMLIGPAFQTTCTTTQININHGYPASTFDLIAGGTQ
jgi:hypothetical protein